MFGAKSWANRTTPPAAGDDTPVHPLARHKHYAVFYENSD